MKNQYGKVSYWVAGAVLLTAFSGPAFAADKITVFAAASLTNALQDIAVQYKQEKQVDVVASYASSSTLARQIEQGHRPICLFPLTNNGWIMPLINSKLSPILATPY